MPSNSGSSRNTIIVIVLGIAVLIAVKTLAPRSGGEKVHEVTGTIKHFDPAERTASIEFIDPTNGVTRVLDGVASADCVVMINEQPAQLTDVREGDTATIKARIERTPPDAEGEKGRLLVAESIKVTRSGEGLP